MNEKRLLLVGAFVFAIASSFAIGFVWGSLRAGSADRLSRFSEERALIQDVLKNDRAFANIQIHSGMDGYTFLSGEVETGEDYYRLRTKLIEAIGTKPTDRMIGGVRVRKKLT